MFARYGRLIGLALTISMFGTGQMRAQVAPPSWAFAKQAVDANGQPITGPVSAGQTITYVLTYQPNSFISGPVTINDTLSASQTYVPGSIAAPPGWSWDSPPPANNAGPPYSVGNHEEYSNLGIGPGSSFIMNVPLGPVSAVPTARGDGTLPIPVGSRVYGIFHHASLHFGPSLNGAWPPSKIMCWDLASLASCASAPGAGAWPRPTASTGSGLLTGQSLATPTMLHHVAIGTKIYFPAALVVDNTASPPTVASTNPGIGCWDTATETPCPFIPLPGGPTWTGDLPQAQGTALDRLVAGIETDSLQLRLFMYAADSFAFPGSGPASGHVYCVPLGGAACAGWSPPSLANTLPSTGWYYGFDDIMMEETAVPTRLYVNIGGTLSCLNLLNNGNSCWTSVITGLGINAMALSPVLNTTSMNQVCLHPYLSGAPKCYDAATGVAAPTNPWPTGVGTLYFWDTTGYTEIAPFHIPGTRRILYPFWHYPNANSPICFDFALSPPAACGTGSSAPFSASWPSAFSDYGYAVDQANPKSCLLGLGDAGRVWRFGRDGAYPSMLCPTPTSQTFDLNSVFCAIKPTQATWDSITILGAPPQLTGGTFQLSFSGGPFGAPIPVTLAPIWKTTFSTPYPATGTGAQLTVQFNPTYTGTPTQGYQLQINYSANALPQICYQAKAGCGPVNNVATMAGPLDGPGGPPVSASAQVSLGVATGRQCGAGGLLKICKVAGPGITVGQLFNFSAGSATISVPAGPPPGGMCAVGPSLPAGTAVTVTETIPPGVQVSNIDVQPLSALDGSPNLATGAVNLTLDGGLTETTYTDAVSGYLEICKAPGAGGNFSFTVNPGNRGPFVVPAGACSPPIQVPSGQVTIQEAPRPGFALSACAAFPASDQGPCNLAAQTSTVTVAPGGISSQTVETITNRCLVPAACPISGRQPAPP